MSRISIEDVRVKMGELEVSNVTYPERFLVDFSEIVIRNVYEDLNGENVRTDEISKIVLNARNAIVANVLKEQGLDVNSLQVLEIEVLGDFDLLKGYQEQALVSEITLVKPSVRLKWVQRANGGGSFNDIRLVCDSVKLFPSKKG